MLEFLKNQTINSPHLKENNMTYTEHCKFSLSLTYKFVKGSCCGLIHSFFPNVMQTSSSDLSNDIKNSIRNRKNDEF